MSALAIRRFLQKVVGGTTQPLTLGGIADDGSDAKLTINTDGSISTTTAVTVPSLVVNSKNVASNLLAEYTVTGSAVTSIDFSGLDINTHKSYRVEIQWYNPATNADIYVYINNDTTTTNYYMQAMFADGTTVGASRANLCASIGCITGGFSRGQMHILNAGFPVVQTFYSFNPTSSIVSSRRDVIKTATVTNITQLTFTSTVANSIGVGSTIRIFRGDV